MRCGHFQALRRQRAFLLHLPPSTTLGMLLGVGLGLLLKFLGLLPQKLGDVGLKGVIRFGILQHAREQLGTVLDVQRGSPPLADEIGTYVARVGLDVGMVHRRDELDGGRLERIRRGEDEGQLEGPPGVRGGGRAGQSGRPLMNVLVDQLERDVFERGFLEVHKLLT